jgi:catechol 2,3-dioxygenase-like lactoylglutathione lyase family enzyme
MTSARILHLSHLVIASSDVPRMARFMIAVFGISPHYSNADFADFVLPSGTRIAFFSPVGKSAQFFDAKPDSRSTLAIGVTTDAIHEFYAHCLSLAEELSLSFSGPPKEHPWGEPSFLLIDPEGNRWEITQSPSPAGLLVNRPMS